MGRLALLETLNRTERYSMTRYYKRHEDGHIEFDMSTYEDALSHGIQNNTYEGELQHDYLGRLWLPTDTLPETPNSVIWERIRTQRDTLLTACDWTMVPDAPTDKAAWTAYRQALRDLPDTQSHVTSFDDIVWPTQPEE